jgi:adenylosuccinate synthase
MKKYFINLPYMIDKWSKENKNILFEGAQGSLLDIYFGTYPYVTSSHTITGGISSYVGIPAKKIDKYIGVTKSYFTRVGSGPFPTELTDEVGDRIRLQGNEYGATTGRPRRCGWFDGITAKYSMMINGIDSIALTLLDVLTGFDKLKICTSYIINGKEESFFPANTSTLDNIEPVYIELPGWKEDITLIKEFDKLPVNAQNYVNTIEKLLEVPINIISVGPNREQTIFK